jgi:hypothetical protein
VAIGENTYRRVSSGRRQELLAECEDRLGVVSEDDKYAVMTAICKALVEGTNRGIRVGIYAAKVA